MKLKATYPNKIVDRSLFYFILFQSKTTAIMHHTAKQLRTLNSPKSIAESTT